jgi:hypothetical protein
VFIIHGVIRIRVSCVNLIVQTGSLGTTFSLHFVVAFVRHDVLVHSTEPVLHPTPCFRCCRAEGMPFICCTVLLRDWFKAVAETSSIFTL